MYDDVQWQGVSNKSSPSILPQVCFVDASNAVFPDMVLWLPKHVLPESVGCFKNPSGGGYICP